MCNCKNKCEKLIRNFAPATYTLVSRTLPDGTVQQGPRVTGTLSFSEHGHRVLAISIDNGDGTYFAVSLQTKFTVSTTSYTDKLVSLVSQTNVPNPNPHPVIYLYDLPMASAASVSCCNGVLTIVGPPYDPVKDIVITKNSLTVHVEDGPGIIITDFWTRVD